MLAVTYRLSKFYAICMIRTPKHSGAKSVYEIAELLYSDEICHCVIIVDRELNFAVKK